MAGRNGFIWFVFAAVILFIVHLAAGWAKCANQKVYYCASVVFEKEMPELTFGGLGGYGKQYCAGSFALSHGSVTAVIMDKEPCPAPGSHLVGHLATLCQDTGRWTKAVYRFSREPDFCSRSYDESLRQARATAAKVHPGMTRAQVHEVMKDFVLVGSGSFSFSEQYYLHPNIGLDVPFDEPNGAYSQDNKVSGPVLIKKMEMAQP